MIPKLKPASSPLDTGRRSFLKQSATAAVLAGLPFGWTGRVFADDSPEMTKRRLKQQNLVGPAGFVSMEDGCVGGFVQRGVAAAGDEFSVMQMGGDATATDTTRATEASVRGFWKAYRTHMAI